MTIQQQDISINGSGDTSIQIKALNMRRMRVHLEGTAPYVQLRFSEKNKNQMIEKMKLGQQGRSKKVRAPRDFDADYEGATYRDEDGRFGIPAASFRLAMISACRTVGFKMTLAKLSVFVEADTLDGFDGTPLVLITGTPEKVEHNVRNSTGVADIRVRAMWREWGTTIWIRWDADQFSQEDIVNLLNRAGAQVGIGEGRPDSKNSGGMGWGTFEIVNE